MKWITNSSEDDPHHDEYLEELRAEIECQVGPPKETDFYSCEELEEMGMVGIYEIKKENP